MRIPRFEERAQLRASKKRSSLFKTMRGTGFVTSTLRQLPLHAPHASQLSLTAPWGASLPSTSEPGLYVVREGSAFIRSTSRGEAIELAPGSIALLPRGSAHVLCSAPTVPALPIDELIAEHGGGRGVDMHGVGGGGREARLDTLCFRVGHTNARRLLATLPELVVFPGDSGLAWTSHVARALLGVLEERRDDLTASIGLTETLLMVALKELLGRSPADLRHADDAVTLALGLIHSDLACSWSVEVLARRVGRSKSAFHDAFARATGRSPMDYVTRARMDHARQLLHHEGSSVQEIAEAVGYETASAFSVAFRRAFGLSPREERAHLRRGARQKGREPVEGS